MLALMQVATLLLVSLVLTPALAHALEWPGKKRLDKKAYLTVQRIYYPGFTFAGIQEPLSALAALVLLVMTPRDQAAFWLTAAALAALIAMQAVYWLWTHPLNKVWLEGEHLGKAGSQFFALGAERAAGDRAAADSEAWTVLRDRWEYSHLVRAACAGVSLVLLAIAISKGA